MIISASRRTDIPAFYSQWFMNRIRAGFCEVVNPYNAKQVSRVSLEPRDVDCIVFWTRYAAPLLPHLSQLASEGYKTCFLYTLVDYPKAMEAKTPDIETQCEAILRTTEIAPGRVAWRYDPIVLSRALDVGYHVESFSRLAEVLHGHVTRVIVSVVDLYRKVRRRFQNLSDPELIPYEGERKREAAFTLISALVPIARRHGMTVQSCAEELEFPNVEPGACIDNVWLSEIFGTPIYPGSDTGQRSLCRCAKSRDIGAYDTCQYNCIYCYATQPGEGTSTELPNHDPISPALLCWDPST